MKGLVGANARAADLMRFLHFVSVGFVVGTEGTHAYAQGDNDMLDTAWVRTGGPLGGLGYDIRFRPDNTDWMYVTDNFAGVFRSYDGGQTWEPSNAGITTRTGPSNDAIPIFSLTVDPNDYDIIWAGVNGQRGIYRSTDGGAMWVQMNNGVVEESGIAFRGFTIEPGNSDVVYAAAEIPSFVWSTEEVQGREFDLTRGVVYRTVDGGENWAEIWRGDSLARYIWIDPRNHDVLYISTGIFDREAANSDPDAPMTPAAAGGVGVVRSTDGGVTWTEVNNGLENLYVGSLFMHPDDPDILLAGTGNNQYADANGAYLSTDGGLSWQQTLDGDKINSVEFAGSDPDIAYAGSANAIYRSENGGLSWTVVSGGDASGWGPPGVRAGFPIDFQVDPDDPNRIFVNNYGGGNFLSEDGGATWAIATQGYTGAQVRDVAVDPTASGRIYAAGRSGLFVSHDGGEQWAGRSYSPAAVMEWYAVAVDPDNPQHVLGASNWDGILCESHDGGASWEIVHNATEGQSWRSIVFDPSDPSTVYTGLSAYFSAGVFDDMMDAGGIYVSHDGGTTWIESNDSVSQNANVTALAVDPENSQVVYAATGNRGILRSIDGGSSWNEINQGLPSTPTALAVVPHPDNAEIVFVGLHSAAGVVHQEQVQLRRLGHADGYDAPAHEPQMRLFAGAVAQGHN